MELPESLKFIFTMACKTPDVTDLIISSTNTVMRISGEIQPFQCPRVYPADLDKFKNDFLADEETDIFMTRKSFDKSFEYNDKRFRIQFFLARQKLSLAIRRLRTVIPGFDTLGFDKELFEEFFNVSNGLVLISGPNSMGKTTTVASAINEINRREGRHIISIEDPIEYLLTNEKSHISQREVGFDTPSFAQGLKDALRANPDIIFLGEMRDPQSAEISLQASETGHFVISTIHSPTAIDTISRVIGLFPEGMKGFVRESLSYYLHGIINQRLVPVNGNKRALVYECFRARRSVRSLIRKNEDIQISTEMTYQGHRNLNFKLSDLMKNDQISYEVAKHYSPKPEELNVNG